MEDVVLPVSFPVSYRGFSYITTREDQHVPDRTDVKKVSQVFTSKRALKKLVADNPLCGRAFDGELTLTVDERDLRLSTVEKKQTIMDNPTRKIAFVQAVDRRVYCCVSRKQTSKFACHVFKVKNRTVARHIAAVLGLVARESARLSKPMLMNSIRGLSMSMGSLSCKPRSRCDTLPGMMMLGGMDGSGANGGTTDTLGRPAWRGSADTLTRAGRTNTFAQPATTMRRHRRSVRVSAQSGDSGFLSDLLEEGHADDDGNTSSSSCSDSEPVYQMAGNGANSPPVPARPSLSASLNSLISCSGTEEEEDDYNTNTAGLDEGFYDNPTILMRSDSGRNYEQAASWFHGDISRKQAELRLEDELSGTYLVRVSQTKMGYSLSMVDLQHNTRHFMIKFAHGLYSLQGHKREFESLGQLLQHYSKRNITKEGDRCTTPLLH